MIRSHVRFLFTTFLAAQFSLSSGCGLLKRGENDDSDKSGNTEDVEVGSEFSKMIKLVFSSPEDFSVKVIEAKNSKGIIVDRDTYEYAETITIKHVTERFDPDGTLTSRTTRTRGINDCDDSVYKSEYFGTYPSKSEQKTVKKCSVQGNLLERTEFSVDENGLESVYSTTTYERNTGNDVVKETRKDSKGKTTVRTFVFDEKSREIEELESVDGKPIEKTITDYIAGTVTVFGPISEGSEDLSKETRFSRKMPIGSRPVVTGLGSIVSHYAEEHTNRYGESTRATCLASGLKATCKESTKDLKTGKLESEIEEVSNAITIVEPNSYFSDYKTSDGKVIFIYLAAESKKIEYNAEGLQSSTITTKTSYNSMYQSTSEEKVKLSTDGKEISTTKETYTYDVDGVRLLTKIILTSDDTVTYTYNY